VRDLASHYQVAAIPQAAPTDRAVAAVLTDLFIRHGAPLVLKSDNHGAFTGREVRHVLERWGVLPLVSPPYFPRYNGAVEAGVGQFKTRAHESAARHDRPGRWTGDDVEDARLKANRMLRPWGREQPTPEARWNNRRLVQLRERTALQHTFEARLAEYERRPPPDKPCGENAAVFRIAPNNVGASESYGQRPRWAQAWNNSPSPGHKRPWERWPSAAASEKPCPFGNASARDSEGPNAGKSNGRHEAKGNGQRLKDVVYLQYLRRRSLTDAMVAAGLLIIRKRRIPLPIKRIIG
jgi:hypothetical protein